MSGNQDSYPPFFKLKGTFQHYAWGGEKYIPELTGMENDNGNPIAEWWLGAHPSSPSNALINDSSRPINQLIDQHPESFLGKKSAENFNNALPFLFKVLDVSEMLSIQAHPTKEQAIAGFKKENEAGIPLDAKNRTFKDTNHKPELMVALSEFWLLHGFKPLLDIEKSITENKELHPYLDLAKKGISYLYNHLMTMSQEEVNEVLSSILERLNEQSFEKSQPEYWIKEADHKYTKDGNFDRGIFSFFLLNLVHMKPRQAIFQDAGILHSYLEGQNVELMANSDNVFRGGLTPKFINIPVLLSHIKMEEIIPRLISPIQIVDGLTEFPSPVSEFVLRKLNIKQGNNKSFQSPDGPWIFFVLNGITQLTKDNSSLLFNKGEAGFIKANQSFTFSANEPTTLFIATIPE